MNPVNVICESCGRDQLVEPEVMEDEEALCPDCGDYLHEDYHELLNESNYSGDNYCGGVMSINDW
jgi:hypothetical protein